MTNIAEVISQLRDLIDRLDRTAVAASRAETEATRSHKSFAHVAQGSNHPKIRQAVAESRTAGEKSGKVARLLAEAAIHFANYANTIAPGSAQGGASAAEAMPSGEDLVAEADMAANAFRRLSKKVLENAESAGDGAKKLTDFLSAVRPTGTASTAQPPEAPQTTGIAAAPGDAARP